jgi:fibronectin-binding autotransporter adhesin
MAGAILLAAAPSALATTYYSKAGGVATTLADWNSDPAGTGSAPGNFSSGDTFVIQSGHTVSAGWWTVSGGGTVQIDTGGTLALGGAVTLSIGGNLVNNGVLTNAVSGVATVKFTEFGSYSGNGVNAAGSFGISRINWLVNAGATLTLDSSLAYLNTGSSRRNFTVNGTLDCRTNILTGGIGIDFILGTGATLVTANPGGINASLQSFASINLTNVANYIFNGSIPQITGALLPMVDNDLTLDNTSGVTMNLSGTSLPLVAAAVVNNGPATINISGGIFAAGQSYTLIQYSSLSGTGSFALGTLPAGVSGTLSTNGNSIVMNVSAAPVIPDVWTGKVDGTWDTTTLNWSTQVGPDAAYSNGDAVVFNDTAVGSTYVNIAAPVLPKSVLVANSTLEYAIGGSAIGGTGTLTKLGTGILTLSSGNTYSGGTTLSNGTLVVSDSAALGAGSLAIVGASKLSASAEVTLNNHVVLGAASTFDIAEGSALTLAGNIAGTSTGVPVQTGAGKLVLTGTNSLAPTAVNQRFFIYDGLLNLAGGSTTTSNLMIYTRTGDILISGGSHQLRGANNFGLVVWNNNYSASRYLTVSNGTVNVDNLAIGFGEGGGPRTFNMDGGSFIVTNVNLGFYCAAGSVSTINLNGGTLSAQSIIQPGGTMTAADNILNLNGGTLQARANTPNYLDGGAVGMTVNVLSNGAIIDTAGFTVVVTNSLLDGGNDGGLTKNGMGILHLTGSSAYTGATAVNGGGLIVSGSIGTGATTVGPDALLGGSGTVGGPTTILSGGTIAPGDLTGGVLAALTLNGNLTMQAGSRAVFRINKTNAPSTHDALVVNGTQNISSSILTVENLGPQLAAGDRFILLSHPTSGFTTINLPEGYTWTNKLDFDGSIEVLAILAPPTPANISFNITGGNQLVLNWPVGEGWELEAQTNNTGGGLSASGWFVVPGATPPFTNAVDLSKGSVFYRLKY